MSFYCKGETLIIKSFHIFHFTRILIRSWLSFIFTGKDSDWELGVQLFSLLSLLTFKWEFSHYYWLHISNLTDYYLDIQVFKLKTYNGDFIIAKFIKLNKKKF